MEKKFYCLYSNKEQSELISMKSSVSEVVKETKYHTGGQWFEYDLVVSENGSEFLYNESEFYLNDISFPEKARKRRTVEIKGDERITMNNISF